MDRIPQVGEKVRIKKNTYVFKLFRNSFNDFIYNNIFEVVEIREDCIVIKHSKYLNELPVEVNVKNLKEINMSLQSNYNSLLDTIERKAPLKSALMHDIPIKEAYWKYKYQTLMFAISNVLSSIDCKEIEENLLAESRKLIEE